MPTTPKSTIQSARKSSTSLKPSKPPRRIFDPNRSVDRYRGVTHKRQQASPENLEKRS